LKGSIVDDDDEEYIPEDDEEEDDEEIVYDYKNNKMINICKRRFENGKVVYRWIKMTKEDAEKKYDEDYICEDN
jgi:hypothetical protein